MRDEALMNEMKDFANFSRRQPCIYTGQITASDTPRAGIGLLCFIQTTHFVRYLRLLK
jgi:hypothetical protein